MTFNSTIDMGNVITVVLVSFSVMVGWLKSGLMLGKRLDSIETALSEMKGILTQVALQDHRLNSLEEQIKELRHGHGFVLEMPSRVTRE